MPQINPSRAAGYSREWWDMAAAFGSAETEFGVEASWLDAFIAMQGRERAEDKRKLPQAPSRVRGKPLLLGKEMHGKL